MEICPRSINIPAIFGLYNVYKASEQASKKFMFAYKYKALDESTRVDKCIDCNLCTKKLPEQNFSQGERRNSRRKRRLRKRQKTLQIRLRKIRRNLPDRRDYKTRRQITDFEHTKGIGCGHVRLIERGYRGYGRQTGHHGSGVLNDYAIDTFTDRTD